MKNRKALFFDVDGTLLPEGTRQIPESARNALKEARSNGHSDLYQFRAHLLQPG